MDILQGLTDITKTCNKCKQDLPVLQFTVDRSNSDGLHRSCKTCNRAYSAKWRRQNPEKQDRARRAWNLKNPTKARDYHLRTTYGITLEKYEEILERQNFVCAICEQPEDIIRDALGRGFCVDHDHETGEIRGILCWHCNKALGMFKDDLVLLLKATAYMRGE